MPRHDRFFRLLTRLFPREFRDDYAGEMTRTFDVERRHAGGGWSLGRLWLATLADIVRTAPAEHLDILTRDLRYAARMLARRPGLTLAAVLTLALGIGANTAIFSVVQGVLFAPLPYPDAGRLVIVGEAGRERSGITTGYWSYDALRDGNGTLEDLAAFGSWSATLTGDGKDAERIEGARVSWNFLRTLGLAPVGGRDFAAADDHLERRRVVILSDTLFQRRYGGDPAIIGAPVVINQATYQVVGVMPPELNELVSGTSFPDTEIWTPLGYAPELPFACRTCRHIQMVGRLRADVTLAQAEADLSRVFAALGQQYPTDYDQPRAVVTPVAEHILGPARRPLYVLWGAVGLLLLMACVNTASLLLIRASEREEEIAIRRALGVSPGRMMRQLFTEAFVLAGLGGLAGVVLAWWATAAIVAQAPAAIPRLAEITVDVRVLLYALGISVVTGVVFGMAPARLLLARRGGQELASRRTTEGVVAWRLRATLVAANVAMAVLLLVGSGLFVRSFTQLLAVDAGFVPSGLLTLSIDLSGEAYADNAGVSRFHEDLSGRIAALPGVTAVTASTMLPLGGGRDGAGITIDGRPNANPAENPSATRFTVRPDYFRTMGIPLRRGRLFTAADGEGAPPVAIIGERMARELWPDEDPLGRRIRIAGGPGNPMRTIVGIVGDVKHEGLHMPVALQTYLPHAQMHYPEPALSVVVRVAPGLDPTSVAPAIRALVRGMDSRQPVADVQSYDQLVSASVATRRFTFVLLALFAAAAAALAVIGLYGAVAYVVNQRQREIGIRVALGAGRREIRTLVLRLGMTPAVIGMAAGALASLAGARLVRSMLYGVSATDALTYGAVLGLVTLATLLACWLPARHAARVDPAVTLKAP